RFVADLVCDENGDERQQQGEGKAEYPNLYTPFAEEQRGEHTCGGPREDRKDRSPLLRRREHPAPHRFDDLLQTPGGLEGSLTLTFVIPVVVPGGNPRNEESGRGESQIHPSGMAEERKEQRGKVMERGGKEVRSIDKRLHDKGSCERERWAVRSMGGYPLQDHEREPESLEDNRRDPWNKDR